MITPNDKKPRQVNIRNTARALRMETQKSVVIRTIALLLVVMFMVVSMTSAILAITFTVGDDNIEVIENRSDVPVSEDDDTIVIADTDTPLAGYPLDGNHWAFWNFIFRVTGAMLALLMGLRVLSLKENTAETIILKGSIKISSFMKAKTTQDFYVLSLYRSWR